MIESCLLQAFICQAQGERAAAQIALTRALTLAEPEGYIRTFVDEGEPMRLLICDFRVWIARQPCDTQQERLSAYSDTLLAAFRAVSELNGRPSSPKYLPIQNLVEPLSERESGDFAPGQ